MYFTLKSGIRETKVSRRCPICLKEIPKDQPNYTYSTYSGVCSEEHRRILLRSIRVLYDVAEKYAMENGIPRDMAREVFLEEIGEVGIPTEMHTLLRNVKRERK